jgi:hypothetical protein
VAGAVSDMMPPPELRLPWVPPLVPPARAAGRPQGQSHQGPHERRDQASFHHAFSFLYRRYPRALYGSLEEPQGKHSNDGHASPLWGMHRRLPVP